MSDDGNRLTAPPTVRRRGTCASSKSRPRSTSSQPTRRAAVPAPEVRVSPNGRRDVRVDLADRCRRPPAPRPAPDATRWAERVGWSPGSGGSRRPGGTRRTPSRRSVVGDHVPRRRPHCGRRRLPGRRRPPASRARRAARPTPLPPAPARSTTRGAPSPGCENTTPTSNRRTSGWRRLALYDERGEQTRHQGAPQERLLGVEGVGHPHRRPGQPDVVVRGSGDEGVRPALRRARDRTGRP